MQTQQHLERQVEETSAVVTECKNTIGGIETQFQTANLAKANAKKSRETHALRASMGDAAAIAAAKHARDAQRDAESTIDDLRVALPAAEEQLVAAEKAAASARHALAKLQAEKLMRQRIDVAGKLDAAISEFARLYSEFEKLGHDIVNMPDALPKNLHGMSNVEGALGARRVRASLPAFFWKLFPGAIHDEMKTENLATSESRFWNLPEQPEKAKAA